MSARALDSANFSLAMKRDVVEDRCVQLEINEGLPSTAGIWTICWSRTVEFMLIGRETQTLIGMW